MAAGPTLVREVARGVFYFLFGPPTAIGTFVEVTRSQPAPWKSHRPKTNKRPVVALVFFIFFPFWKSTHVLAALHLKNSLNTLENFPTS